MRKIYGIALGAAVLSVALLSGCISFFGSSDTTPPVLTADTPTNDVVLPFTLSGTVYDSESYIDGVYISTDCGASFILVTDTASLASGTTYDWSFEVTALKYDYVLVYAEDTEGNDTSDTTVQFVVGGAEAEPNDSASEANTIIANGYREGHISFNDGDADWYKVYLISGYTYSIETTNSSAAPADAVDTHIYTYDTNTSTLVAEDDDGGDVQYSLITGFDPSAHSGSGYYYIKVYGNGPGDIGSYRVKVDEE